MIAALFGVGIVTGGGDEGDPSEPEPQVDVRPIVDRLERVRRLEFKRVPEVRGVSSEEAREEGLAELDRGYPPEERAADEEVLIMLGLLPRGSDIRELAGTIFGEQVAGYYDPRTERMTIVGDGEPDEITLAHELTHALDDQHFEIESAEDELDDARTARSALVEGTATVAMVDYAAGGSVAARRRALGALDLASLVSSADDLPPYLQRSLLFPYAAGARFVDAIGTWGPANRALRGDGPQSTEQVMHPEKYEAGEPPLPVRAGRPRGRGWESAAKGTIGEFDTAELIRTSDSPARAARAAAGWGGGSYRLWRRGARRELHLAWRWDSPRDAAEFAASLPRYIERTLRGRAAATGGGRWRAPGGVDVTVDTGAVIRLTIASG